MQTLYATKRGAALRRASTSEVPSFTLTSRNTEAVAEVCRKLDGLPLAIELATARVGLLTVEQIAERLEDSLGLLSVGHRTAVPRQQTLRAMLEWSHELLSKTEKTLFCRLSAFAGGFTLRTAEAVCPDEVMREGEVIDLLSGLVDKSMVVAETSADAVG
jgi:predicted ATPase